MASYMADSDENEETVLSLPDEMLEILFHHFSGVSIGKAHSVCKKWNAILLALATRTDLWFRCCLREIPKMTLMQLCNHPLEPGCRSRMEWKDIYVRWRLFRGSRLFHRGKLEQKKLIQIPTPSFTGLLPQICYTDDIVYVYIDGKIVAFDVHSEAVIERHHSTVTNVILDIHTLSITVPINHEDKTAFEATVERGIVVLLMKGQLEILAGLESKSFVNLQYEAVAPMCTWYDTIMVQIDMPGSVFEVHVYKVKLSNDGASKVSLDHIQTCWLYCSLHAMLLTGNKALMLEGTTLMIWDIAIGEECRSFALTSKTPNRLQKGIMSWVGTTVAVTEVNGPRIIILYHLDEECENLQTMTRLNPKHSTVALQLLYDDSILVSNKEQCNLVLYKSAKSTNTDDIFEGPTVHETSDHDGGSVNDSLVPESRIREPSESDTANLYKSNLSYLLGISEGDPLWNNFDAEVRRNDRQLIGTSSDSDSDWSEQSEDSGSVRRKRRSAREESIFEQSRFGMIPHDVSSIPKPPVKHKRVLCFPYKHESWNYFFTNSAIVIDTVTAANQVNIYHASSRLFVYKWS